MAGQNQISINTIAFGDEVNDDIVTVEKFSNFLQNFKFFKKKIEFYENFHFFFCISFYFWYIFRSLRTIQFLTDILIYVQNFDFCPEVRFLFKIWIFCKIFIKNFDFCPKIWFLSKI